MKYKELLLMLGMASIALASCSKSNNQSLDDSNDLEANINQNQTPEDNESGEGDNNQSGEGDNNQSGTGEGTTQGGDDNTQGDDPVGPVVSEKRNKPSNLASATLWIVGDSTVDEFIDSNGQIKDKTYFYERSGWGGHVKDYSDTKLTIKNYGSSGASSKDYLGTSYYSEIMTNMQAGDFLMIGFGHNDEKSDSADRFTDASKPITDSTSFQYSLYENYIKKAEDKGVTPILCTPIVRLSKTSDYSGSNGHITSTGDYRQAIIDLGASKNVKVIDLTTYTKNLYTELGYDEAKCFHAVRSGLSDTEPNYSTVDATHINNYGAKTFDYYIAEELYKDENCYLGNYILDELTKPTKEKDLVKNSLFKYVEYSAPNLASYVPQTHFKTLTAGWYGTGFGDCGGEPYSSGNGYVAKEVSAGVFNVGQCTTNSASYAKGKIASTSEGIAFLFKQLSINDNFEFSADATIISAKPDNKGDEKQRGFGLMLRDACWIPDSTNDNKTNNAAFISNYVAAGILQEKATSTVINYSRDNETAYTKSNNSLTTGYAEGETAKFSIKRVGQSVVVETTYKDKTYTTSYLDFDFEAKDSQYIYVGMYAARGTIIEFTNVSLVITGQSQGA